MAKAVGIGGVFLHFEGEEKEVMNWYNKYLGLELSPYGSGFIDGEQLVLLSFKRGEERQPYLNLRVDDIREVVKKMRKDGVRIVLEIQNYDYGQFARFEDPFGNLVELWEPVIDKYKEMVREEITKYKKANS